jgi:hypothetical protein
MTDPTETREALDVDSLWPDALKKPWPTDRFAAIYEAIRWTLERALGAAAQGWEVRRPPDHYLCWCGTVVSPGALRGATLYETHGERHKCPGPPETVEVDDG